MGYRQAWWVQSDFSSVRQTEIDREIERENERESEEEISREKER